MYVLSTYGVMQSKQDHSCEGEWEEMANNLFSNSFVLARQPHGRMAAKFRIKTSPRAFVFFSAMADDASEPPAKRQRFMDLGNFCFLLSFGSVFGCLGPTAGLAIIKILGSEAFCACGRPALLAKSRH